MWYKEVSEIPPTVEKNHEKRVNKFLNIVRDAANLSSRIPRKGKRRYIFNPKANTRNIIIGTKMRYIFDIFLRIQPATAREVFENSEGLKKISVDSVMSKFKKEGIIIPE